MQVVFTQVLGAARFAWEARLLKTNEHVASLVERPDGTVEVTKPRQDGICMVEANLSAAQRRISSQFNTPEDQYDR